MNFKRLLFVICCCFLLLAACVPVDTSSSLDYSGSSALNMDVQSKSNVNDSPEDDPIKSSYNWGLQGNYTVLATATDGDLPKSYGNLLEFSDSVIVNYNMPNHQWNVEQFEIDSGKSVALISSSKYSDKGNLYEIAYTQDKDGYDYCLLFEKGILYRSSTKHEDEYFESLPTYMFPESNASNINMSPYHRNAKSYLWTGMDGIMLSATGNGETVCIMPNDRISAVFADSKFPNAYKNAVYSVPRFVNKGSDVIAQVRNENDDLIGIALCSLADNTIAMSVELGPPFEPTVYPAADRYICIGNGGSRIIDTLNRTVEAPPLSYFFKTHDCLRYIQVEVSNQDYDNFKAFLCTADQLDDRSNIIVSSDGANGVYIANISSNYFTVASSNADDFWLALVPY